MTAANRTTAAFVLVSMLLFLASGATGAYLMAESEVGGGEPASERGVLDSIHSTPGVISLLANNLTAIGLLVIFPFCLVVLLLNGFNIGRIVGAGLRTGQLDIVVALVGPHGVFEFSAMFLAGAVGLRLPYEFVQYLRGRKRRIFDRSDLEEILRLLGLAVALTVVAAVIETYVTLEVAEWLLG